MIPGEKRALALRLAEYGIPLFPVQIIQGQKQQPLIKDWPNLASSNPAQVGAWWRTHPDAIPGLPTGARSGIDGLDIDVKNGKDGRATLAELERIHTPLSPGPVVRTLSGGEHRWRQHHPGLRNTAGRLGEGIDTRGDGGYLAVYHWPEGFDGDVSALPEWPQWILDKLAEPALRTPSAAADTPLSLEQLRADPPGPGGRNDWMTRVAGHHARTHRDDWGAYEAACRQDYDLLDHEDFGEEEFQRTIRSIWGREHAKPRRPVIDATGPSERPAKEAWDLVTAVNNPPRLFRSGGLPSRLETGDDDQPQLVPLTQHRMGYELASIAAWQKRNQKGELFECDPPTAVVQRVLATPDIPLPVLERVIGAPMFARDGSLQAEPGYHPGTRCLYVADPGFSVPAPPPDPSRADIDDAKWQFDELVCDFPFASDAAKAHALALFLLPFCRELIAGPTPLHLFDKPAPGTGAGLLAEVLLVPGFGHPPSSMSECRDDDEWRKRITAKLAGGAAVVLLDNLTGKLNSAALSAALTQPVWEDRILGHSQIGRWRVRCIWVATANNLQLNTDTARRTVRIRLDAGTERPWMRQGWKHELPAYAYAHRTELVSAALIMVQAWLAAGRPRGRQSLGSYDAWVQTLGGVLDVLGVPGFLMDAEQLWEDADSDRAARLWLVQRWYDEQGFTGVPVSSLVLLCGDPDCPLDLGDKASTHGLRTRLGQVLAAMRDQHYTLEGGQVVRIERCHKSHGNYLWRLLGQERLPLSGDSA